MEQEKKRSAWDELFAAVRYALDSKKGKYSLETYLEIIGEYTDRTISDAAQEGLRYRGGECRVRKQAESPEDLIFEVVMYFYDAEGQPVVKEATRNIPKQKFTREAVQSVGTENMVYRIDPPEKGTRE